MHRTPRWKISSNKARQAALHSYSPYSGFRVGAALRLSNGEVVTGTNVENVQLRPHHLCRAFRPGPRHLPIRPEIRIEAVAVANLNNAASPPCGACRQVLAEFILPDAPVLFPAADGMRNMPFSALLPLAFNAEFKSKT